jgi:hypothetical protein
MRTMTLAAVRQKWETRRDEWRRLRVSVDGEQVALEVLADLDALERSAALELLTLAEASQLGGYSVDHLQRLVAAGQIANAGKPRAPRIQRGEVPLKPGYLRPDPAGRQFDARRRIVASVANRTTEAS